MAAQLEFQVRVQGTTTATSLDAALDQVRAGSIRLAAANDDQGTVRLDLTAVSEGGHRHDLSAEGLSVEAPAQAVLSPSQSPPQSPPPTSSDPAFVDPLHRVAVLERNNRALRSVAGHAEARALLARGALGQIRSLAEQACSASNQAARTQALLEMLEWAKGGLARPEADHLTVAIQRVDQALATKEASIESDEPALTPSIAPDGPKPRKQAPSRPALR